ncbi:MAG TPA: T9SS type A sorting domain-containing protein [bacterium]|nr:T9SS type A sorting domain-containing protein [bacterium]
MSIRNWKEAMNHFALLAFAVFASTAYPQVGNNTLVDIAQTNTVIKSEPYLSSVTQTSIIVSWQTDIPSDSEVEYGLTDSYDVTISDTSQVMIHSLKLTGLDPSTTYHYQVKSGETASEDNTFQTAVTPDEDFIFVAYGDTRTNPDDHLSVVNRIIAVNPKLVLNVGDLVEEGGVQYQWDIYFDTIKDLAKNTPIYSATGNHEGESPLYYNQLFLPHNNPDSTEKYYSFDYGNSHFIALNTNIPYLEGSAQYTWLESDLEAASSADYIFVVFHHPPYCSSPDHGSDLAVRDAFCPLFETYGVDIVFTGHTHIYERTILFNGVTYIVTGGGGAPLHHVGHSSWTAYTESTLHLVKLSVSEFAVNLWMIRPDGTVGDSATVLGPMATRTKTISEKHTFDSITVIASYAGDVDNDGSATLDHKLSSESTWVNDGNMERVNGSDTLTISGLTPDTEYDIRVTYSDPDGVVMTNPQIISNIRTLAVVCTVGGVYAGYSPQGIVVSAFYAGDANANGSANLEHKLSSEDSWIDDGSMTKDSETFHYWYLISDIEIGKYYDVRVTYSDPDGVVEVNVLTLIDIQTTIPALRPHPKSIIPDENLDDWRGTPPSLNDTGILDHSENEYIWKDATHDDLGDGGDAPNASDNPQPYSYPTGSGFSGTEADIEEFRIAYDENNLYFLVDLAGSAISSSVPFSIILIDKDGPVSGSQNVESKTEVNLSANHAWDYKITANNNKITVTDILGTDISTGSLLAQNLDQDFFEISVPISTIGRPSGSTWSFALLQTLGSADRVSEILFYASISRSGGGSDELSDPDIYDLIGASGEAQYADLNNYTDTTFTVLSNSWVDVTFNDMTLASITGPQHISNVPEEFMLFQNHPNPFNSSTSIQFELPDLTEVELIVYDILGREVNQLINQRMDSGYHQIVWDGDSADGKSLPSGLYFALLRTPKFNKTVKMVLLK